MKRRLTGEEIAVGVVFVPLLVACWALQVGPWILGAVLVAMFVAMAVAERRSRSN